MEVLGLTEDKAKEILESDKNIVKVAKYVDKDKADKIRKMGLNGIEIEQEVKRYYPMGAFASNVLGSVTDDNASISPW